MFRSAVMLPIVPVCSLALAGPPLSIDDPGILGPGELEFIAAATVASTDSIEIYQVPSVDVSLGVIEDYVQASLVYSYVHVDLNETGSQSDVGNLELGVKWRFLNTARLQMALAPHHIFRVARRTAAKGIGESRDILVIPVNAEYRINDRWRLNGEVRYASIGRDGDLWGYGSAVAFTLDEGSELLFEIAGISNRDLDGDFVEARIGFDAAVNESFHVLFSTATGLRAPSAEASLDYDVFLGFQFFR